MAGPSAESLAGARELLERITKAVFPASFSDRGAPLVDTGRRAPTDTEKQQLGVLAAELPFALGRRVGNSAGEHPSCRQLASGHTTQSAAAAARPAWRPENRQPPRKVPSIER